MPPEAAPLNLDVQEQLTTLMARIEAMQVEINTLRAESEQSSWNEFSQVVKELTVSQPEPFSGTEDLPIFLQQCELSFDLQPSRFLTDYHKIRFILSYFRGSAARWAHPYFSKKDHELRNDLSKFITAIEEAFGDPTRQFRANTELRTLK